MQHRMNLKSRRGSTGKGVSLAFRGAIRYAGMAFLLLGVVVLPAQSPSSPGGVLRTDKAELPTAINQPPDANEQMELRMQKAAPRNLAAADIERRKQIADDSVRLLKLAAELKAEIDKTAKDTLSLTVIRKADEIERLAHQVKEKMKLTMGAE
jgi:hypothetical protein